MHGESVKTNLAHKGRGKFKIIESAGGKYVGETVDASDIVYCLVPSFAREKAVAITREANAIVGHLLEGKIDKTEAKRELAKLIEEITKIVDEVTE